MAETSDSEPELPPFDMRARVTTLIQGDACGHCLRSKAASLESFVGNMRTLTRTERKVCLLTSLSILFSANEARPRRSRSGGERVRFYYYVPFVGRVCRGAFQACFEISAPTLTRYRRKVKQGSILHESELE